MKYNNYSYIYPPRPKNPIPTQTIGKWDNGSMLAQPKLNGSNCLIFSNGSEVYSMNRHNQRLTNFQLNNSEILELYRPNSSGWIVLNGEYMNKSKRDENGMIFNHKFVIFDILVFNSDYMVGSTFDYRTNLLENIYGSNPCDKNYLYQITDNIYHVKNYKSNFVNIFNDLSKIDMIEGIVIKRRGAKLELGTTENNNARSMVKARKSTKNYKF